MFKPEPERRSDAQLIKLCYLFVFSSSERLNMAEFGKRPAHPVHSPVSFNQENFSTFLLFSSEVHQRRPAASPAVLWASGNRKDLHHFSLCKAALQG